MSEDVIQVDPSDKIFRQLGHNNYSDFDIISELIDNAIAERTDDRVLEVEVTVGVSDENAPESFFEIRDNASGIARDELGEAISPGATAQEQEESLNEHGVGMKQAVAAAGELDYLKTKDTGEETATVIREFAFGDLEYEEETVPYDQGTEIRVTQLRQKLRSGWRAYGQWIRAYLGARYRRFLDPRDPEMELKLEWKNLDEGTKYDWWVSPIEPIYFHPSKRQNRPVVLKKEFRGDDWKAEVTFGYAPEEDDEYEELGVEKPKRYEPYAVALKKQGLDILKNDRVIQFHQLAEIGLVKSPHNQYNHIRGEIDLLQGFSTAITKNLIENDERFEELMQKVKNFLESEDLISGKRVPSKIPEPCLRDRLKDHLENRTIDPKDDVTTEFAVQGLGGYIDVLADGEAYELKVGQAGGLDVYQLLAYMDLGGFDTGYLVAESFTTGAEKAEQHINSAYKKTLKLAPRDDFPINEPLSPKEIEKYV